MKIEFVRFKASDGLELQGWLTNESSDIAVVHIHGMSGNGYENKFLDNLREVYSKQNISFFTIDSRGRGIISYFNQPDGGAKLAGSCFEIFEESIHDIQGAIDYLKSLGKKRFILQGHSLGGSKVVNYILSSGNPDVIGSILLAPTDMTGWVTTEKRHDEYLKLAEELIASGKPEELVSAQCWLDNTPLSAQTYPTLCKEGTAVDIYNPEKLGSVSISQIIIYGSADIGITKVDETIEKWTERVEVFKNSNTSIEVIPDATHSFKGHESVLSEIAENFVKGLL
jgi:predicted alpha/beta hydrolase family esterase